MVNFNEIVIIHEYGEPSHYIALTTWAKKNDIKVKYIEFSIARNIYRAIKLRRYLDILRHFYSFFYLIFNYILPPRENKKIYIVGMAPLDKFVFIFNRILKNVDYIYHTSWLYWDGGNYPKCNSIKTDVLRDEWCTFLSKANAIACVTPDVKNSISEYFDVKDKAYVVYHAYDPEIFHPAKVRKKDRKKLNIVYLGRLERNKGIEKLDEILSSDKESSYKIIGRGTLEPYVNKLTKEYDNIEYLGYFENKNDIAATLMYSDIILLPSMKILAWEELFGISLIEAMACGCIPIVTDHKGPKTILTDSRLKKLILSESLFIPRALELIDELYSNSVIRSELSEVCIKLSSEYTLEKIGELWVSIIYEKIANNQEAKL